MHPECKYVLDDGNCPSEVQNLNGGVENGGTMFGNVHIRILSGVHTRQTYSKLMQA